MPAPEPTTTPQPRLIGTAATTRRSAPTPPHSPLRFEYGRGTAYERELHLTEALSALIPADALSHPEHRLFQIAHLITELAWAGMHDRLCRLHTALGNDDYVVASGALDAAAALADPPLACLRLLSDNLSQPAFLSMRGLLTDGASGLDSPGARNLRKAARAVWQQLETALVRHHLTLDGLTTTWLAPSVGVTTSGLLADVVQRLYRFDSRVLAWKHGHMTLVWQLLGGHPADELAGHDAEAPTSMRGRPITDLTRLARPLFPALWQHATAGYHATTGGDHASTEATEPAAAPADGPGVTKEDTC